MASAPAGAVLTQVRRLFGSGTAAGLGEAQLLERYLARRDEGAFEALVARFGPMVLTVCRDLLDDPHDAEDAFQATFLVLVEKAASIRDRDRLGNWLYGVALRTARRARVVAARRRARERQGAEMIALEARDDGRSGGWRPTLHEEIGRLPAKYREPVVLCYLDGLSHEEAAARLSWPLGTVKGRLSRARDLLRTRLTRRGLAVPSAAVAAAFAHKARAAVPPSLIESTTAAAISYAAGRSAAVGVVSATVATLTREVLSAMFLSKLKTAAVTGALTLGLAATGAGVYAYQSSGGDATRKADAARPDDSAQPDRAAPARDATQVLGPANNPVRPPGPEVRVDLLKRYLDRPAAGADSSQDHARLAADRAEAAHEFYDLALEYYQQGIVKIDRVFDASLQWAEAERVAADSPEGAIAALEAHVDRLKQLAQRGAAKLEVGVGSRPDVAEAQYYLIDALYRLAQAKAEAGPKDSGPAVAARTTRPEWPVLPQAEPDEDEERTELILAELDERIDMPFPDETPLEDVIAYVKQSTRRDEFPEGIPIYIDPSGLEEANLTVESTVRLDLKGVKLRTSLRILLDQLGLDYRVKNGLLMISSPGSSLFLPRMFAGMGPMGGPGMGGFPGGFGAGPGMMVPGGGVGFGARAGSKGSGAMVPSQGVKPEDPVAPQGDAGSAVGMSPMGGTGMGGFPGMKGSGMKGSGMMGSGMMGPGMKGSGRMGPGMKGSGMMGSGMGGFPGAMVPGMKGPGMGVGFGAMAGPKGTGPMIPVRAADPDSPVPPQAEAEDDEPSRQLHAALEKTLEMRFPNDTPLEDVLNFIQSATISPQLPNGIQFYVDPAGLEETGHTLTDPIAINLIGIKLKASLRLLLRQLGLVYRVEDGILVIDADPSHEARFRRAWDRGSARGENADRGAATSPMPDRNSTVEAVERPLRDAEQVGAAPADEGGVTGNIEEDAPDRPGNPPDDAEGGEPEPAPGSADGPNPQA